MVFSSRMGTGISNFMITSLLEGSGVNFRTLFGQNFLIALSRRGSRAFFGENSPQGSSTFEIVLTTSTDVNVIWISS